MWWMVVVVPNLAITDFASYSHTQYYDVCNILNCKNHQSLYTCLSRGSILAGTIIVQLLDSFNLKGDIPESLRQKFRKLKLLDDVTKL